MEKVSVIAIAVIVYFFSSSCVSPFEARDGFTGFGFLWEIVPQPDCVGEEGVEMAVY